jgi:hypothetical protein
MNLLVEVGSIVNDLDLWGRDEGRGTHGYMLSHAHRIGEGLTDLYTQHPRELLNTSFKLESMAYRFLGCGTRVRWGNFFRGLSDFEYQLSVTHRESDMNKEQFREERDRLRDDSKKLE